MKLAKCYIKQTSNGVNKLFIIGIFLALALVLGLTLTWPKYQAVRVLQNNIQTKKTELQSQKEYFAEIKEISKRLEGHTDALDKISSALPETPSLASLFSFLQLSAGQSGLFLKEIALAGVSEGKIQATIKLFGDYPGLKNFLLTLENSARIIEAENVVFESPKKSDESFTFVVQLKTYSY